MANEADERFLRGAVKSVAPAGGEYDIEVVCSDEVRDRSDEVIVQAGWKLDRFQTNPVFLAQHKHTSADARPTVIGSFASIAVQDGGKAGPQLVGRVRFADTELGREYKTLYRDGHMRAVSVGFQPMGGERRNVPGPDGKSVGVYHHTAAELIEVSAVAVGCNQNALSRLRELGYGEETEIEKRLGGLIDKAVDAAIGKRMDEVKELIVGMTDEFKAILPDYLKDASDCHPTDRPDGAGDGLLQNTGGQAGKGAAPRGAPQGKSDGGQAALEAGCQALASAARI